MPSTMTSYSGAISSILVLLEVQSRVIVRTLLPMFILGELDMTTPRNLWDGRRRAKISAALRPAPLQRTGIGLGLSFQLLVYRPALTKSPDQHPKHGNLTRG